MFLIGKKRNVFVYWGPGPVFMTTSKYNGFLLNLKSFGARWSGMRNFTSTVFSSLWLVDFEPLSTLDDTSVLN